MSSEQSSSDSLPATDREAARLQMEKLRTAQERITNMMVALQSQFGDDIDNDETTSTNAVEVPEPSTNVSDDPDAVALESTENMGEPLFSHIEQSSAAADSQNNRSVSTITSVKIGSEKALETIRRISEMEPPTLEKNPVRILTEADIRRENLKRQRIKNYDHAKEIDLSTNELLTMAVYETTEVAPSVRVDPLPLTEIPNFTQVLEEMGIPDLVNPPGEQQPLYMVDCRIISLQLLKKLIIKRAEHIAMVADAKKVDVGTQTYVTTAGKQLWPYGCINCKSREHHFRECNLPYRPGFCTECGAEGFDTKDCIYPHGIEHERVLGRCIGCSGDEFLYSPECPDCNIRHAGIVDWLRLNYATWPSWMVPRDHQFLIGGEAERLKRKVKAKFDNPRDEPNKVRKFLLRENVFRQVKEFKNLESKTAYQMSEEKRQRAIEALLASISTDSIEEVMRKRPELSDGQELKIIVPTKFKNSSE
ncbi:uncharacterized protein LOC127277428 isoform X2 [Leptopilina boulardi]|uniref:uncharacterized protein LOC127277428 isoform X1 n=1 Tax=Leptopilina boulardi TaxID=63433 RepID=UPI0021F574F7|nr:uncharacterized protein LOC127277428 isoform X1 [Leptopilina boulardi]XP_051154489.1 uncharacterized protein LOC127277428 isoform X2 [Leptopilina boulardi]XP_051154491.1 uncharacterized protein LOC127277428 isoform X2 [Leptopilina boulardi]